MKHLEHNGQRYLAVGVPPEIEHYIISDGFIKAWPVNQPAGIFYELLPAGNYEIVGLVGKIRNNHSNGFEFFMDAINNNPWNALREFNNLSDSDLILKCDNNHSNER